MPPGHPADLYPALAQVLPSLGEEGVQTATLRDLVPGVTTATVDVGVAAMR